MPALLAVVAAFMAGLAIGASGVSSVRDPGRFYGLLEIAIGVWAALTTVLIPAANKLAAQWIGIAPSPFQHWFVAFVIPLFTLLPATAAMGATLPVIEQFVSPQTLRNRSIGALYAVNAFGAVTGVLLATFVLLPNVGLRNATFMFAGINLVCGALAFLLVRRSAAVESQACAQPLGQRVRLTLFVTGLLGIGYEVIGVRVLAQVLENTVYTYAAVLAVFLFGTALGGAAYHRYAERLKLPDLLSATALACLLGVVVLTKADDCYAACRNTFGDSVGRVLVAEMIVAAGVFLLSTICMGATFGFLVQNAGTIGRAVAVNTCGAAIAPALFSVGLLPLIGSKWTLIVIAIGYLAALPTFSRWGWFPVIALPLAIITPATLRFIEVPLQGKLLDFREGTLASIAVVQDATGHRTLKVDNRFQMGGTGSADAEYRHAHIPLLLHPSPRRALFLGLGTGITFSAADLHTTLVADGVELLPEVIEVMPQFAPANEGYSSAALSIHAGDARRFVLTGTNRYDVIVGDLFHPARDGAGSLYTLEHFRSVRDKLAPGGLFCQWLPLHQLDMDALRVITRTFVEVFPETQAWLLRFNVDAPVIGLIGFSRPVSFSHDWIESRIESLPFRQRLQKLALNDSIRLFGNYLLGADELHRFSSGARINTDDNATILFAAPRFSYLRDAKSYGRLLPLLELTPAKMPVSVPELSSYLKARNIFLKGLVEESEGRLERAFEAYIQSAHISLDFTPGYARIMVAATAESRTNPDYSRTLLTKLIEAQPSRPAARELLERLFPKPNSGP